MATPRRDMVVGKDSKIVEGIENELDPTMVLHLNGKTFTPAQLAAFVRRRLHLLQRIEKRKARWLSAIAEYTAHDEELKIVLGELRVQVYGLFGRESERVKSFSFSAPKKPVRTEAQKTAAVEKARATRQMRGTKGRKARLKIKGTGEPGSDGSDGENE